ncbi:helix-turn-helix domain-containing protein [Aeromicrobium sp. HA]|uniref:helix-turn-helix domain-containing protein n=1 Tax=Aeromicrobium sp. HA TaxID=3009077 RepID=UPI0022AFFD35|nr:helix-turn-helix transcriptional regulator [Aeromicrobium sp. HA]
MESETVIEAARRAAGMTQAELARRAQTQQSSISEYERKRKSPTLDVVDRLVDAADAKLVVEPLPLWDEDDSETFIYPERLWRVCTPQCFARVQVWFFRSVTGGKDMWDLADRQDRIEFYEIALQQGFTTIMELTVDGALLVEAWPDMDIPDELRAAWQPAIDAASGALRRDEPPLDPGGYNAEIAAKLGWCYPPRKRRKT